MQSLCVSQSRLPQSSSASPVCNPGWLGFLRHADKQEGWYEFADAHVNVKDFSENFAAPFSKFKAEEYPFRTTCYKIDRVWHVLEANLKIDPPDCDLTKGTLPCKVMTTIFSKEPLDMQQTCRGCRRATGGGL